MTGITTETLIAAESALTYPKTRDVEARATYHADRNALVAQWKDWLHDEYGSDLSRAQFDLVYDKAWDEGHASGYREVENLLSDLVDWVERLLKA